MIIILWAFGIFLLQSRYDFGPQAETRCHAEHKGRPFPPTGGVGAPARTIDHQRVTRECQRRVGGVRWSTGPDGATANTLLLQDGRIRIRTLVYTVQAEYVHVRPLPAHP